MVAREKVGVLPEQHGMAGRMAGRRDREEIFREARRLVSFQCALGRLAERVGVPGMDDPSAAEAIPERRMVRHIVAVREEHRRHAACADIACRSITWPADRAAPSSCVPCPQRTTLVHQPLLTASIGAFRRQNHVDSKIIKLPWSNLF